MRAFPLLLATGLVACATVALAHGPTPKKVDESVQIKADPKAVWAVVGKFADIAKWDPELTASTGDDKKAGDDLQRTARSSRRKPTISIRRR